MLNNLVRFYCFAVSGACLFRGFGSVSNGMTVRVYDLGDSVKIVTERFHYSGKEDYHNARRKSFRFMRFGNPYQRKHFSYGNVN